MHNTRAPPPDINDQHYNVCNGIIACVVAAVLQMEIKVRVVSYRLFCKIYA